MNEAFIAQVKFDDRGLVPAVARDHHSGVVLMLAYQNEEALRKTLESGTAHYFSRSRNRLWQKGETSGHIQRIREVRVDCDGDTILLLVDQTGPACHTGHPTCFFTLPGAEGEQPHAGPTGDDVLRQVYQVIEQRRDAGGERSYVKSLFEKGPSAIHGKVTEEAGELVEASREGLPRQELVHEAADLWFHSLVLLASHGVEPEEIYTELKRRFGRSGLDEKEGRLLKPTVHGLDGK